MKSYAGIELVDVFVLVDDDNMDIDASLDEGIGRVHRHPLRSSRTKMRDHKSEPLSDNFAWRNGFRLNLATRECNGRQVSFFEAERVSPRCITDLQWRVPPIDRAA